MGIGHELLCLVKDSFAGEICYRLSNRRLCRPCFEKESYVIPAKYYQNGRATIENEKIGTASPTQSSQSSSKTVKNVEQSEETIFSSPQCASKDISLNNIIIVDWDSPDDPENPHNWHIVRKSVISIIMALSTASLYMGSALFTPAEGQLVEHFKTSVTKVTLGLSLFVWGYGLASLWFSPMSENPVFGGRNYIYLFAQLVFTALQIPTALTNHIAPFAVLRLLAGFMAAPPLSTGGATFNDIFEFPSVVYALIVWSVGGVAGPSIGPLIGGALVQHNSWRWAFWYLLIQAGAVLAIMVFFFPETSHQALLMRKARILRRRTGNKNILAPGEIEMRTQHPLQVLKHIFWQPIKLTIREPVLLLINIHLGLMYAVNYLYFEAVPIAYGTTRGWNLVEQGLSYVSIYAGCGVMGICYLPYLQTKLINPGRRNEHVNHYHIFGDAAVVSAILCPVGILIFGWTSNVTIHWFPSLIGNAVFGGALWLMFQSYLSFLAHLYPPSQIASVFASNSLARAVLAAAFPLFARPMYNHTAINGFPVGWGCSILAFIAIPLIGLPVYMRIRGEALHERALEKYGPR